MDGFIKFPKIEGPVQGFFSLQTDNLASDDEICLNLALNPIPRAILLHTNQGVFVGIPPEVLTLVSRIAPVVYWRSLEANTSGFWEIEPEDIEIEERLCSINEGIEADTHYWVGTNKLFEVKFNEA